MDSSEQYIEMCKVAHELQGLRIPIWGHCNFEHLDLFLKEGNPFLFQIDEDSTQPKTTNTIWLPRMDQLVYLIAYWNRNHSLAFFEYVKSESRDDKGHIVLDFDSVEKHLLAFYMKEQYNKHWSQQSKSWISICGTI